MRLAAALLLLTVALHGPAGAAPPPPPSVYLEELTWTEVRDAIHGGCRTVIVPVGGTEQSGPHLALGKHNARVRVLAGRVAEALGHALVAPVVAYVPEGRIDPPAGHMRYPGTISVSDATFTGVIEGAARSFRQHGFSDVVLIGDHGGYQAQLAQAAARLDRAWMGSGARVHYVGEYYRAAGEAWPPVLRQAGLASAEIGTHAGAADTSLTLALAPALVRPQRTSLDPRNGAANGFDGDPRVASAALGRQGAELIVERTVAAIRTAEAGRR